MNYELAAAYIAALTQSDPNTVLIDVRSIHDKLRDVPAHTRRGTLPALWEWITSENAGGRGIFVNISDMDGAGLLAANVRALRCQVVDLDGVDAQQQYERLIASAIRPAFAVASSRGRYHVYWTTDYHTDIALFTSIQRRLAAAYHGDPRIHDPSRVLRLPGTYHNKGEPHLVTCWALGSYGTNTSLATLDVMLFGVDAGSQHTGTRSPLGTPELAAPSLEWLRHALRDIDPNTLGRSEWTACIGAIKQAGWTLTDEATLRAIVLEWCARYDGDNPRENVKEWNSYRATEVGWSYLAKRSANTHVLGRLSGYSEPPPSVMPVIAGVPIQPPTDVLRRLDGVSAPTLAPSEMRVRPADTIANEILTGTECSQYFNGCIYVVSTAEMHTPDNRRLGPSEFNVLYGGKKFIVDSVGKLTDEPWKAATRSTVWRVPLVDHMRFIPTEKWAAQIPDALGRMGLNVYYPITHKRVSGDVSPFLRHLELMFPSERDRQILVEYMAHNVKFPGYKIPWAPVIQSAEGVGKGVFRDVMQRGVGGLYFHAPSAGELIDSGSKFNGWMLHKLFICVDEIRVDEKRELVEILKPMLSETQIEVQRKGRDQVIEDNYSNWMFFTNYKDAIPVDKNTRRFSVFYSPVQTLDDMQRLGMGADYFDNLWNWLREENGFNYVIDWLLNHPIERGSIAKRAPMTTTMDEAFTQTRSPLEKTIRDAVEDNITGFRGGYVSVSAVATRVKQIGQMRTPSARQIGTQLEKMGYRHLGRAPNLIPQEDAHSRPDIYARDGLDVSQYCGAQGYR